MKNTRNFLISFLLGGAVGGTIALLYAPKSGKHLRNDISRKTNELIEESRKKTHDVWNGAMEKAETTFDNANDFLNSGIEKISSKAEKINNSIISRFDAFKDRKKSGNRRNISNTESAENARGLR